MHKKFIVLMTVLLTLLAILKCMASNNTQPRCERCVKLEQAIVQVLHIIKHDQTDYYLDVLCETDEMLDLEELLEQPDTIYIIKDSTYRKLRKVFPDLPVKQIPLQ